jgi:hypothetical protein
MGGPLSVLDEDESICLNFKLENFKEENHL